MNKKVKDAKYYRVLLNKDCIVLFILSLVCFVAGCQVYEQSFDMGIYAALFIPFVIAFATHKVVNGFVGIWIALISIASIACYFSNTATLFTVAFSLLGVICLIHSIIFLVKLKSYTKK